MKKAIKALALLLVALILVPHVGAITRRSFKAEDWYRARVVKITSTGKGGQCSGEQVRAPSGKDYILSAWHCRDIADKEGMFLIVTEEGQKIKRKLIATDPKSDLLIIEGLPELDGLTIAKVSKKHEHVRTYTHGGGLDTWRSDGELIMDQEINIPINGVKMSECHEGKLSVKMVPWFMDLAVPMCIMTVIETATTARIIPGSSGGMVVNDAGELVGVVSAGDQGGTGWLVRLIDIQAFMAAF